EAQWRRVSLLPELHAGRRAGRQDRGFAPGADLEQPADAAHAALARGGAGRGDRHLLALLHDDSASGAGGWQPGFPWQDRAWAAAAGGTSGLFFQGAENTVGAAEASADQHGRGDIPAGLIPHARARLTLAAWPPAPPAPPAGRAANWPAARST